MSEGNTPQDPWHAALLRPQSAVEIISAEDLHSLLEDTRLSQILVVDDRLTAF